MKLSTTFFGHQDIDENEIITFPKGLPGFEGRTRFKLFHEEGKPTVFWLQSVDDADLMFSVAPPELFGIGYEFALSNEEETMLKLTDPNDVGLLLLLGRDQSDEVPTKPGIKANLGGPLVVNTRERIGMQKVLQKVEQTMVIRAVD